MNNDSSAARATSPNGFAAQITSKGGLFVVLFALLLSAAIVYQLYQAHKAAREHDRAALDHFAAGTINLASTLDYFFMERGNDMLTLAESRQVLAYFENKALGMSPAYGLLASRQEVEQALRSFLADRTVGAHPIYEGMAVVDTQGQLVAQAGTPFPRALLPPVDEFMPHLGKLHAAENRADRSVTFAIDETREHGRLLVSCPLMLKDRHVGYLVTRLRMENMLQALFLRPETQATSDMCLAYAGQVLFCQGSEPAHYPPEIFARPGGTALIDGTFRTLLPSDDRRTGALLVSSAPVGTTGLYVLNSVEAEALLGAGSPWGVSASVSAFSMLLLAGIVYLGRATARSMSRSARLQEKMLAQTLTLKRMEEFDTLFNGLPGYAVYKGSDGRYLAANAAFCDAVGVSLAQLVGKRDSDLFPPEIAAGLSHDDQELLSGRLERSETDETMIDRGRSIRVHTCKLALRHSDGTLGGIIGLGFDLSEKLRIEDELRASNELMEDRIRRRTEELADANLALEHEVLERKQANRDLSLILRSVSAILIGVGEDGLVLRWNEAAVDALGIPRDKALGRRLETLPLTWEWDQLRTAMERSRSEQESVRINNVWYERTDGQDGYLGFSVSPMLGENKSFEGLLLLGSDLTDVKSLEAQLAQAQKLEAIGQLAAGIAHEINTPAQYVMDSIAFLRESFENAVSVLEMIHTAPGGHAAAEVLEACTARLEAIEYDFLREEAPRSFTRVADGLERITTIVSAMKRFAYAGGREKKALDLNNCLQNTLVVSHNEWKYLAEAVTDFDPDLPPVVCVPGEINQVLLNVVINAAHAIGEAIESDKDRGLGRITVTTRQEGDMAHITIADTGNGIPEAIRDKVYNMFFTTKEVGKGTGQGLAIAYDIVVKKHGGSLSFDTTPGEGTAFHIRLPIDGAGTQ